MVAPLLSMKTKAILPLVLVAMIAPLCAEEKIVLKDQKDKAGYSIGASIGGGLKRDGIDVNVEALVAGLRDSFTGAPEQLTAAQQEEVLALFRKEMTARRGETAAAGGPGEERGRRVPRRE